MDELLHFLDGLLRSVAPGMGGLALISAPVVTGLVGAVKRFFPNLQGNVNQTIAAGITLVVVLGEAATPAINVFGDGVTGQEVAGLLLVSAMTYLMAVGFNETTKNRNEPGIHPKERPNDPPAGTPAPSKLEGP
jgi:hypothetical protein